MGLTVLYIAFGIVALWLLGEVLLQYKARLRWRLLAFSGFLTVVLGVLVASRVVIALGTVAFAVGQTYVTLSFRRGFSTGWAIGGRPGASRRRKAGSSEGPHPASPEGSGPPENESGHGPDVPVAGGQDTDPVYEPQPLPDDTGQYGVYDEAAYASARQAQGGEEYGQYDGVFDPYYGQGQPGGDGSGQYDYGTGQQQYPAYSDPYVGGQQYGAYDNYDSFGNQQQYGSDAYYAQQPQTDTPPGGVWVPQQRDAGEPRREQSPYDYEPGHDEKQEYRY
ncbi:hypothetical protein ACWEFL_32790 [Streptomyces sp. NPDC004838]